MWNFMKAFSKGKLIYNEGFGNVLQTYNGGRIFRGGFGGSGIQCCKWYHPMSIWILSTSILPTTWRLKIWCFKFISIVVPDRLENILMSMKISTRLRKESLLLCRKTWVTLTYLAVFDVHGVHETAVMKANRIKLATSWVSLEWSIDLKASPFS